MFLISQLPARRVGDTGVRATAPVLADLLVEDLADDGARLRKDVPRILEELVEQGRVMKLGDEFRLQTEEGAEWTKDFNQRRAVDPRRRRADVASSATSGSSRSVDDELAGLKLVHGKSKTPRKLDRHWGDDEPATDGGDRPGLDPRRVGRHRGEGREAAAAAGDDSPIVFVLLPEARRRGDQGHACQLRRRRRHHEPAPEPQTDEGRQAKQGMQSRVARRRAAAGEPVRRR